MSRMQKCGLWQLPRLSSAFNSFKFTNVFWIIIHYLWQFILLLFSQEYFLLIYRHSGQNVHNSSVKLPVPIYNWWNCEFIRSLQLFDLAKFNILCDLMKLNDLIRPMNVQLLKLNHSFWLMHVDSMRNRFQTKLNMSRCLIKKGNMIHFILSKN